MADNNLVIHGVGIAYISDPFSETGNLIEIGHLQDMTIEINTTKEDVFGGDSIFPIYTFTKDKTAQFTFTNAKFNLNYVKMAGADVGTGGIRIHIENITVNGTTDALSVTTGLDIESAIARRLDTGVFLKRVSGTTPATGEFSIEANGTLHFNSELNGKQVEVNVLYSDTNSEGAKVLTTSIPGFVQLRHISNETVRDSDNTKWQIHTIVYKARCDGKLTIDYKRGQAFAPKLTFTAVDPERPDKMFFALTPVQVG